ILADYVIARHYPTLVDADDKYLQLLNEVIQRTAKLMAQWQAVGFAHGVMNTDNMSILGLTFDYGPFGFMEAYDAGYICNHSDPQGRYAFDQQPQVGLWNLACLAQALSPLIPKDSAESLLESYAPEFYKHFTSLMGNKLGLSEASQDDIPLISELLEMMQSSQIDFTHFFRGLGNYNSAVDADNNQFRNQFIDRAAFDAWEVSYRARLLNEPCNDIERKVLMDRCNPKYILRNYLAQIAIEKAEKDRDFSEVDILLKLLQKPFDEQPEMERYAALPPEWAQKISVSCSS
ncbi:MAG: protein adenylyltransferase SelO family protein, partial [Gallionella sp.]